MSQTIPVAIPQEAKSTPTTQIPNGSYTARIYSIIDLGTQENTFDPAKPPKRQFRISFETPTKKAVFNPEKGEQPFVLHKEYAFTISRPDTPADKQSGLTKLYKATKGTLGQGENIFGLLGSLVSIQTEINQAGYATIISVNPVSSDLDPLDPKFNPVNPVNWLYLEGEFNQEAFDSLPTFIQEKIVKSPEYALLAYGPTEPVESDLPELDSEDLSVVMPY